MKRCVILQLTFVVTIFSNVIFAKDSLNLLDDDEPFSSVGRPAFPPSEDNHGKCLKDILVIIDASKSVGKENFDKVKKFLKDLVSNQDLDVSPEGTHVAFMVFSSEDSTKILQDFDHNHDKLSLNSTIKRYEWNEKGYTRTDIALQKANQMFKERSPLNHRDQYDDVILLITDGEPHDRQLNHKSVIEATKDEAKQLKDKGVTIVGVGIGDELNMKTLEDISGPEPPINAESFDALPTIKKRLVAESCVKPGDDCDCPPVDEGDKFNKSEVIWAIPEPNCANEVKLQSIKPEKEPGEALAVGPYIITYTYKVEPAKNTVDCNVSFTVKENTTQQTTPSNAPSTTKERPTEKPTTPSTTKERRTTKKPTTPSTTKETTTQQTPPSNWLSNPTGNCFSSDHVRRFGRNVLLHAYLAQIKWFCDWKIQN